ncbi:gamma-glutamylcyclotransferase-like [Drosophila ficusphila]|uniref:gamma-glutamylcyclotransferase-like n=1 Tax=Drosophila ficusphila TaxID=30025 RepID=UPI0007E79A29|nr:gamma-glutamylcyclotransferase-like [Drosophila ficusphila]XP_017059094.1 gamma-glutamylcyclotransferase-like [Drosophila ficusphila]XP_017059095.1 gamma-glutamylcyclotransferase-like [Drosophila ficusphila]
MYRDCLTGVIFCLLVALSRTQGNSIGDFNASLNLPEVRGNKFLYFGFGSNMLADRIHIQNPTAVKIGPALLPDYRLDFAFESGRWGGAVATIVPTLGDHVWGTLWEIDLSNLPDIDNQEGVHEGIYESRTVYVTLRTESKQTPARAYLLTKQPETNLYELSMDSVPASRQPSKTYLQCLVKGAIESSVPEEYVRRLKGIKHNGHVATKLEEKLELQNIEL